MNVYEKAQQLLELIGDAAVAEEPDFTLPKLQYARVGTAVIACECVQVAALDMNTDGAALGLLAVDCGDAVQMVSFACIIARDCAFAANEDGSDDPAQVAKASGYAAADAAFLWSWANGYDEYISKNFSVGWTHTGGIVITTLTLTTGVD